MKKIGYELWLQIQPQQRVYLILAHGKKRVRVPTSWKIVNPVQRQRRNFKSWKEATSWLATKHPFKDQTGEN